MDHGIERAAERIASSDRVVALTGAGVSAESGIATFRDAGGLWDRFDPDEIAAAGGWISFLIARPWDGIEFLEGLRDALASAAPNGAHRGLAELEEEGRLRALITQNVDGLHREAGSRSVIELHGTFSRRRCMGCARTEEIDRRSLLDEIGEMIAKLGSYMVHHPAHLLRRCDCGSLFRPDIVNFGEPVHDLGRAVTEARGAEVMIVCGTSGVVYPAAGLPEEAKGRGAFVIEVNPEPSELSHLADVTLRGRAGDVLPELVGAVRGASARV